MAQVRRRRFLAVAAAFPFLPAAYAQPAGRKISRIGFVLSSGNPESPKSINAETKRRLLELGHVEGRDYVAEILNAEGRLDRIPGLVDRLVQQKVDIIVLTNNVAIGAAKKATQTIPIVMVTTIDPVTAGYVSNLARPGGNITGLAMLTRDLSAKRVELLKELLPAMDRVAILWDAAGPGPVVAFRKYEATTRKFKLRLQSLEVRGPAPDFEGAFRVAKKERADALIVVRNPLIDQHRVRIMELAKTHQLPAMCEDSQDVGVGGLMSYGANAQETYKGVVSYVDRILKGAKPGDLPIQQPANFEFVVNLKTARALGLTIPQSLLLRADRVIE